MKLSTRGKYGLKAMFELALHEGEVPIPLKQIAEKHSISDQYLEQIFSSLKKAELVKSVRGAQGGYLLSGNAEDITVGNVLRVLEGNMKLTDCQVDEGLCENSDLCATRAVWTKLQTTMEQVVDSISLKDMVDDYYKNLQNHEKYHTSHENDISEQLANMMK